MSANSCAVETTVDLVCSFLSQSSMRRNRHPPLPTTDWRSPLSMGISQMVLKLGRTLSSQPLWKGMFHRGPPVRKLAPLWSIKVVLLVLSGLPSEPIQNTPRDALTRKDSAPVCSSFRLPQERYPCFVNKGRVYQVLLLGAYLLPDPDFLSIIQTVSFTL